jgi:N-acetylmuramoyl-L-alanine amidase
VQFARGLASEMRNATRMHKQPVKSAGFRVLRAPDVPSVLIELGFVSNRADLKFLTSEAWRNRASAAIARAVDTYFAKRLAGGRGRQN